jgi:small-conductance mechanosensitive channel
MKRFLIYLLLKSLLLLLLAGCGTNALAPTPPADMGGTVMPESTVQADDGGRGIPATVSSQVASRTPMPTSTPGFLDREMDQIAARTGWQGFSFLGLTAEDWINIVVSILIFFIGYWVLTRLLFHLLLRLAKRTKTNFDDEFLHNIGPEIERVVGIVILRYVVLRLDFISATVKSYISDILFVLGLIMVIIISLKLVNFTVEWYEKFLEPNEEKADEHLDPLVTFLQHASYILIIITGILIGLVHFGIEISLFTSILLIVGLGLVIGARSVLADLVGGFIILLNQPFRVGDAIKVQGWQDWGHVENIGSRTTQIRTLDNRTVIIPNSTVSSGRLINYSTPDPTIRAQTDVRIAYHADLNQIRKLITETVRGVEGVLPNKPIEILYREFGNSTRLIRLRWWISTIDKEFYIVDTVNSAIEDALTDAGIEIPFTTLDLSINQVVDSQSETASGQEPKSSEQDSA